MKPLLCLLAQSSLLIILHAWSAAGSSQQPRQLHPRVSNSDLQEQRTIPIIDLSTTTDQDVLAKDISDACSTYGFFQVQNHGISQNLIERFREQCKLYFDLPLDLKRSGKRNGGNSRGFFDDELTKQRRDWKECLDVGVPGSRDWSIPDDSDKNACLDGLNQFPGHEVLPDFRKTVVEYFEACAALSDRLARLMARGVGLPEDDTFIADLKEKHSSYLRMNFYPICGVAEDPDTLGISPHKDAGFLTVLLQDDDCHSLQAEVDGEWIDAHPVPGALTINTGDMAQIWSNGKYKAPLHRVLADKQKVRYSAPFFYNPGYQTCVQPFVSDKSKSKYTKCLWGYFRAVRFAGDLTDLGVEIQIDDFEKAKDNGSAHLDRQGEFYDGGHCDIPFDVGHYEHLLKKYPCH